MVRSSSPGVIYDQPAGLPHITTWRAGGCPSGTYSERMRAEGWYRDPYGLHTDRWFSDGQPTDLVRDGTVESRDTPPSARYSGALVESAEEPPEGGADLRRADEAESGRPPGTRTREEIWAISETEASGGLD